MPRTESAIVLTRLEARFAAGPGACLRNAVLVVSDGTVAGTVALPVTAASIDSGPTSASFAAGTRLHAGIAVSALCGQAPAAGNVSVQ